MIEYKSYGRYKMKNRLNELFAVMLLQSIAFIAISIVCSLFIVDEGIGGILASVISMAIPLIYIGKPGIRDIFSYRGNYKEKYEIVKDDLETSVEDSAGNPAGNISIRKPGILAGVVIFSALILVSNVLGGLLGLCVERIFNIFGLTALRALEESQRTDTVTLLIYSVLVAPIVEELVYRGVIQRGLAVYGARFSIVASALFFGSMHQDFIHFFSAFAAGLVLSYTAYKYSIWMSIFLHFINNTITEISGYIYNYGGDNGPIFDLTTQLICVGILLVAAFVYRERIGWIVRGFKARFYIWRNLSKEYKENRMGGEVTGNKEMTGSESRPISVAMSFLLPDDSMSLYLESYKYCWRVLFTTLSVLALLGFDIINAIMKMEYL